MKKIIFPTLLSLLLFIQAQAQFQNLQKYFEEGHSFQEVCKKGDKLFKKNKIEEEEFRKAYNKGKNQKVFLDDEKLKWERWKYYWRDRLTEDGSFPDLSRTGLTYSSIQQDPFSMKERQAISWKFEGPAKNSGGYWSMGRATHVAFHPTETFTFYVATPNGGLWKTTDGGKTYKSIGDALPYQPVGIVIIDPKKPDNIYVSLGEKDGWWQYSMGVYKSTDGGKTWNPSGLNWKLTDNKVIYGLEINPINPNVLIAATSDGLYKTNNAGSTWTKIRSENFSDVKYKPNDTSTVYAALNDYWGSCEVYRSRDGGKTFNQITTFGGQKGFMRLAVTPDNPEMIAVNYSLDGAKILMLSKDAGNSFTKVSDMPDNSVFFISGNNTSIMYCGYVVLYQSRDEGKTWTQICNWWNSGDYPEVHADHHFAVNHPKALTDVYFACDGGIYKFNESTSQFTELVQGLAVTQFYKMAISTTNPPVLIGGSQDNGGWIRRSNGTWGNTNGGDAMWQLIDPTNANIGYTEYWGGNAVYRSTNGFASIDDITANIPGSKPGQWVTPFNLNPKNPKTFIIGYSDIYISHDRGNTFKTVSTNLTGSVDNDLRNVLISPADTNIILATRGNILYSSLNYGRNWKSTTLPNTAEITGLECHPKDTNKMWVCLSGYGSVKVMVSKNKGSSWTNITKNFVNTPTSCIAYDEATNVLFVGTDLGVFYSDADVVDWKYYGSNLPHTTVTDIEFHQASRRMYVSTFGRGFYSVELPDCYPLSISIENKIDNKSYTSNDTLKVCYGQSVTLRSNNANLKGIFRWRGPGGLDSSYIDNSTINLGILSSFQKTGNYILEYNSATACIRYDTIYVRVLPNPTGELKSDNQAFHCNLDSIELKSNLSNDANYRVDWINPSGNKINDQSYYKVADAGIYYGTIINRSTGCFINDTIVLDRIADPKLNFTSSDALCFGEQSGKINWTIQGGKTPYQYMSNHAGFLDTLKGFSAGDYYLKAIDSNGCSDSLTITIHQPNKITSDFIIKNTRDSSGLIESNISGGIPPYILKWTNNGNIISHNKDIDNLFPGYYSLTVIDSNGCQQVFDSIEIKNSTLIHIAQRELFQIYPNPTSDKLNIEFYSFIPDIKKISVFNVNGEFHNHVPFFIKSNKIEINTNHLIAGNYFLILESAKQKYKLAFTKI